MQFPSSAMNMSTLLIVKLDISFFFTMFITNVQNIQNLEQDILFPSGEGFAAPTSRRGEMKDVESPHLMRPFFFKKKNNPQPTA